MAHDYGQTAEICTIEVVARVHLALSVAHHSCQPTLRPNTLGNVGARSPLGCETQIEFTPPSPNATQNKP